MTIPAGLTNHVEMAYRPGCLGKAMKLLTLLGCQPQSSTQPFNGVLFHFAKNERLWISEVSAEQWAFEQWLERQMGEHGDARTAVFLQRLKEFPQAHGHFGLGTSSLDEWERIIGNLQAAIAEDLELAAHVSLPIVQRPDEPDSVCGKSGGRMGKTPVSGIPANRLVLGRTAVSWADHRNPALSRERSDLHR